MEAFENMKSTRVLLASVAGVLIVVSGCSLFQPAEIVVTNNTGAEIEYIVNKIGGITPEEVDSGTLADGDSVAVDVGSLIPVFGSNTNGEPSDTVFSAEADGKYLAGGYQSFVINEKPAQEVAEFTANAASVTLTNNGSTTFDEVVLGTDAFGSVADTTVFDGSFAPGESIVIAVTPNGDYFKGKQFGILVRGVSLSVADADIGTDISRNTN